MQSADKKGGEAVAQALASRHSHLGRHVRTNALKIVKVECINTVGFHRLCTMQKKRIIDDAARQAILRAPCNRPLIRIGVQRDHLEMGDDILPNHFQRVCRMDAGLAWHPRQDGIHFSKAVGRTKKVSGTFCRRCEKRVRTIEMRMASNTPCDEYGSVAKDIHTGFPHTAEARVSRSTAMASSNESCDTAPS